MWEIITHYWVNFLLTSLAGVLTFFAKKLFNILNEKLEVINEMQKQISQIKEDIVEQRKIKVGLTRGLHNSVYLLSRYYIKRGKISSSELKNLTLLYEAYQDLGGNGTAKVLYEKCKKLPLSH